MTTLRELRQGYLLHVLVALASLGRPAAKTELADEIGCSREAVEDACRILSRPEHNLAIALPNGRWPLWALTDQAKRLLGQITDNDYVSMTPLGAESGVHSPTTTTVLSINHGPVDNSPVAPKNLTPLGAESSPHKVSHSSFADETARILCKLGGVTYPAALNAVQTALDEGDTQTDITEKIKEQAAWIAVKIPEAMSTLGLYVANNLRTGD